MTLSRRTFLQYSAAAGATTFLPTFPACSQEPEYDPLAGGIGITLSSLSQQLSVILHSDMGHWADQNQEPPGNCAHDDGAADEVADEPE